MLLKFKVRNYASIKDEIVLDLVPGADKKHEDFISLSGKNKALNCLAIYGANASGKSNLMKAIKASVLTIRESNTRQINAGLFRMVPFKFDSDSINEPCSFEYTFIAENSVKYVYGFSATEKKIVEEYLYKYTSAKPSLVFELDQETGKYNYPKAENKVLSSIVERNSENRLLLSTAANWNYDKAIPAYTWFLSYIDTYDDLSRSISDHFERYSSKDDFSSLKDFTIRLLKAADINIVDYDVTNDKVNINQNTQINGTGFLKVDVNNPYHAELFDVYTNHVVDDEKKYKLNIREESLGTINLFGFSPILEKTMKMGRTIFVDELERSLHPNLSKLLIELFKNTSLNRNGAQLIFTTHSTNLLDLDLFRRDQIFFTEKDPKNGITDLYSLSDFPVRNTENIEKGYLLGRYGAIPYLHPEDINEQI